MQIHRVTSVQNQLLQATSRLFGYGGKVFFEHRSAGGADSHDHEIWQFSRDGAAKVCDYVMVQYRIEKVGSAVRRDEP
jgi:hypothetical protein